MLSNTVQISEQALVACEDPVNYIYERLLDAGCPISTNGSLAPGNIGFSSWTVDGRDLCLSWGQEEDV